MNHKKTALALLVVGVLGFVLSEVRKGRYEIFDERITNNSEFVRNIGVQNGNTYLFSFWGNDEETGLQQWADMEFVFRIETASGEVLAENRLVATESEESGGIRRAQNGDEVQLVPTRSEDLKVTATLVKGDYLDIEVYENMPESAHWMPVLFVVVFIAGLILLLRARNKAENRVKSVRKKTTRKTR